LKRCSYSFAVLFFLIGLACCVYAIDQSLVLYLPMDENAGKVARDLSIYKNDASLEGNPKWVPGKFKSCIEFSPNNYLKVKDSNSLDITKGLTIELWVTLKALNGAQQSGVEKGNGWVTGEYNLLPEYNGGILLQILDLPEECDDEGQTGSAATMADGNWHFIAGTWDGNMIKIYIDGKESNRLACKGEINPNADPLYIGCRNGAERWVTGLMDEIKIYNYALSKDEIVKDMTNPIITAVSPGAKLTTTWGILKQ